MRKHLRRTLAALIAVVMCLSGFTMVATAAFGWVETRYFNHIGTGDINIKIEVWQTDSSGNEVKLGENDCHTDHPDDEYSNETSIDFGKVLPGQTVSYITKVTNLAESAWIRIDPVYLSETNIDWLSDDNLSIATPETSSNEGNWELHDGYYYYTKPVATGDTVIFSTDFSVPDSLTNDTIPTQGFRIFLNADAVQSDHFEPGLAEDEENYFSDDPWFGTPIEVCYHYNTDNDHYDDDGFYHTGNSDDGSYAVRFENGSQGFLDVPQDFFDEWAHLMPGDEVSGEITVKNNYDAPVTIYFWTEMIDEDSELYDEELLNALILEIKSVNETEETETTIYSGSLYGSTSPVALGHYTKGEDEAKLIYTVSFDKDYQNAYTLKDTQTIWVFAAELPYELPSPGGAGMTALFIAGTALMVIGAAMFIILNKKKGGVKA